MNSMVDIKATVLTIKKLSNLIYRILFKACSDGDFIAVRKLLKKGLSVHELSDKGLTLLSIACSAGYYEVVQVSSCFLTLNFQYFKYSLNMLKSVKITISMK